MDGGNISGDTTRMLEGSAAGCADTWRRLAAVALRRARRLDEGLCDIPDPDTIADGIIALRPKALDDGRLLELADTKPVRYSLHRYLYKEVAEKDIGRVIAKAFSDGTAYSDYFRRLKTSDRRNANLLLSEVALRRLAPENEAYRTRVHGLARRENMEPERFNAIVFMASVFAAAEAAFSAGRAGEAASIIWLAAWGQEDPYLATVACELMPGLRASFPINPPPTCPKTPVYDRAYLEAVGRIGDVIATAGDRFAPAYVSSMEEAINEALENSAMDLLESIAIISGEASWAIDVLAEYLPSPEMAEAARDVGDVTRAGPYAIRLAAAAYCVLAAEEAATEKSRAAERETLKGKVAAALKAEDYKLVAELSQRVASMPAEIPPVFAPRITALLRLAERDDALMELRPEPPAGITPAEGGKPLGEPEQGYPPAAPVAELAEALAQRDEAEAEARHQAELARAAWLEVERLKRDRGLTVAVPAPPARPSALTDIPDWAASALEGRLALHARAVRGLKKAVFEDVGLVADVLEMLASNYRDSRMPGRPGAAKEALDKRCAELGVEVSPTVTSSNQGRSDPQLWVNFEGRRLMLDMHVKRGIAMDRRVHLRVYFAWDEETRRVVVGQLPDHIVDRNSR